MRFPFLKELQRRRSNIAFFYGYEHLQKVRPGAFYDMKNLSSDKYPLLSVRPDRLMYYRGRRVDEDCVEELTLSPQTPLTAAAAVNGVHSAFRVSGRRLLGEPGAGFAVAGVRGDDAAVVAGQPPHGDAGAVKAFVFVVLRGGEGGNQEQCRNEQQLLHNQISLSEMAKPPEGAMRRLRTVEASTVCLVMVYRAQGAEPVAWDTFTPSASGPSA